MIRFSNIGRLTKSLYKIANYRFSERPKYKIVDDPKDVSKLVFDEKGKCLLFEHRNGES